MTVAESTDLLRVALAQINPTVGDIRGNARKISGYIARARRRARAGGLPRADAERLPARGPAAEDELPRRQADAALRELAAQTHGIVAVVGFPEKAEDVYNAAAVLADGEVVAVYRKMYLPNYGVFDEQRYFQAGPEAAIVEVNGIPIGLSICEDIWEPGPPAMSEALAGAQVIVNLSASPYRAGYGAQPRADARPARGGLPGGGGVREHRRRPGRARLRRPQPRDRPGRRRCSPARPQFEESLTLCTIDPRAIGAARLRDTRHRVNVRRQRRAVPIAEPPVVHARQRGRPDRGRGRGRLRRARAARSSLDAEIYAALRTGLRDYVEKNGFERVVVALSGGIDSALAALLAVDALGPERVTCVSMPSPYSSEGTRADARAIAENLGVDFREIAIDEAMDAYDELLREAFEGARARRRPRRTSRRASAATW